jgi:predicted negative regulator of RcsB-dependent stress response
MNEKSAFDLKNIEKLAVPQTTGLLEQLNIPPAAASYIRRNQRAIWIVVICISLAVTAVSLYGSYRTYREDQASSALTLAMQAEGDEKKTQLVQFVDEYGSTSAGMWGRIELAQMAAAEGQFPQAIDSLAEVKKSVSVKNPVSPLLVYNLAILHEKNNDLNQALTFYNELLAFKGFEAISYEAMGRIYEVQDSKDKALEMYKKYMETGDAATGQPSADPDRSMIQARINRLEN